MPQPDRKSVLEQQVGETGVLVGGGFILFEPSANRLDALREMRLVDRSIRRHLQPVLRFFRTLLPSVVVNGPPLPAQTRPMDLGRDRAFLDLEQ